MSPMNPRLLRPVASAAAAGPSGPLSLLLHFDEDFSDSSDNGLVASAVGSATISGAETVFGSGSAYFGGSGSYLTIPAAPALDLGTGDFTIEMWAYLTDQSGNYPSLFANGSSWHGPDHEFNLMWDGSYGGSVLAVEMANNVYGGTTQPTIDEWHHIAITRESGTVRLFLDGAQETSWTFTGAIDLAYSSGNLLIGSGWNGSDSDFVGYLDEFRVLKGIAAYTSAFSPPASPF